MHGWRVFVRKHVNHKNLFVISSLKLSGSTMKNLVLFCGICMQRLLIYSRPLNHCMTILSVSFIKVILYYL